MKLRKLQFVFLPIALFVIYISTSSYSGGINGQSTSGSGGCYCHGANNSATIVNVTSPVSSYSQNQLITFTVTVANASKVAGGFNLTTNIGDIISGGAGTTVLSPNEISHNSRKFMVAGVATWTFTWQAPASGNTPLTIEIAGNAINNLNGSSGDAWNFGTIPDLPFAFALAAKDLNFEVKQVQDKINLTWSAKEESTLQSYELEKSTDAKTFSKIYATPAKGNQTVYQVVDESPFLKQANYYRLKMIDQDGAITYSGVKMLHLINQSSIDIFPTLVSNGKLNVQGIEHQSMIQLFAINGSPVFKQTLNSSDQITLPQLPQGNYLVVISNQENGIQQQQMITIR